MARDKRSAPPGGSGAPSKIIADNSDSPKHTRPSLRPSRRPPDLIPIGQIAAEVVADMRFRRQIERLHRLGPRAVAELLAEIGAERGITAIVDRKLATYAAIDPMALEVASGDKFWPVPIHEVGDD